MTAAYQLFTTVLSSLKPVMRTTQDTGHCQQRSIFLLTHSPNLSPSHTQKGGDGRMADISGRVTDLGGVMQWQKGIF